MKVLVGVNVLTSIDSEIYGSHTNFWYRIGKQFPNDIFLKYHPRRLSIDNMRNAAALIALQNECDYLMFIDDDVDVPPDAFRLLLEADQDVVMGLTYIRGYPFHPMFFKAGANAEGIQCMLHYEDFMEHLDENGLVKDVVAVGFSCVLIKCSLLKKLHAPFFVTGARHTEDIYFCVKAKIEQPDCTISVSTKCPTSHFLDKQPVCEKNVKALRDYYEAIGCKPEPENSDRGLEYIQKCIEQFGEFPQEEFLSEFDEVPANA